MNQAPRPSCPPGPSRRVLWVFPLLIAAIVAWNARAGQLAPWQWLAFPVGGVIAWTFVEYTTHRWLFHIVPASPWLLEHQQHLAHHAAPRAAEWFVIPLWLSLPVAALLWSALRPVAGSWHGAALMLTGAIAGYVAYELVHYWIHLGRGNGRLLRFWRRHHLYHHYRDDDRCFGFTTSFWDVVFGTARPRRTPAIGDGRAIRTSLSRAVRYVRTMFPPRLAVLGALAFLSTWLGLQALAGQWPLVLGRHGLAGALLVPLWMLLVRLLDDLHDAPEDRRLAQAGDPRYRDRPIVTGTITEGEIRHLIAVAAGGFVLLTLIPPSPALWLAGPIGLGLTWLGFRWFFIPALAKNPGPLAYLVRKSLAVLVGAYAVMSFRDRWPEAVIGFSTVPLLLAPVFEVAVWETARKIRLPEEETSYPTYSRLVGWRRAALLPAGFAMLAAGSLSWVAWAAGLGAGYPVLVGVAALLLLGAGFLLRLRPTPARARLEPAALGFAAVAHCGFLAALILRCGFAP